MRADFVASVSHELRTPLTSILGFADTLLAHGSARGDERHYVEIIRDEGERLRKLIDALLDLRQLSEGAATAKPDVVDIAELLEEQVERFGECTSGHELVLDLAARPLVVRGEHGRLEQVVVNLLSNAIKYSPEGGTVELTAKRSGDVVRVAVRDEGRGIPEDQQSRIFTKFFRGDAGATGITGTGLGLAVSREIVEAHGGSIGFDSDPGEGSTFWLVLPGRNGEFRTNEPKEAGE
jgi:two-component system phosphate regulon sensor histidine kinase PhoR